MKKKRKNPKFDTIRCGFGHIQSDAYALSHKKKKKCWEVSKTAVSAASVNVLVVGRGEGGTILCAKPMRLSKSHQQRLL